MQFATDEDYFAWARQLMAPLEPAEDVLHTKALRETKTTVPLKTGNIQQASWQTILRHYDTTVKKQLQQRDAQIQQLEVRLRALEGRKL